MKPPSRSQSSFAAFVGIVILCVLLGAMSATVFRSSSSGSDSLASPKKGILRKEPKFGPAKHHGKLKDSGVHVDVSGGDRKMTRQEEDDGTATATPKPTRRKSTPTRQQRKQEEAPEESDEQHTTATSTGAKEKRTRKQPSDTSVAATTGSSSSFGDLVPITSANEMKKFHFFRLQEASTKLWLSRPVDTNVDTSSDTEKVFRIEYHKKYKAYSIKGHTRMHLTCELNNKVTIDRMWARSFEQWKIHFSSSDDNKEVLIESRRNSMFLRLGNTQETLMADVTSDKASKWLLYGERADKCHTPPRHSGKGKEKEFEAQCWGPISLPRPQADDAGQHSASPSETFPLFGSPKPVAGLKPKDENEPFDSVTIARRTLTNWGSVGGIQPFILTSDPTTQELISSVNDEGLLNKIQVEEQYEVQKKFDQPTYRGLFQKALDHFPEAKAVAYSNSDILFTPSLPETINKVIRYVEKERERKQSSGSAYKVKGWMIVGQRVNHVVPAKWNIDTHNTSSWVNEIETDFARSGELFESDAEDYFIVSRGLFDWMKDIPDFVVGGVAFDNWITNKVNKMAIKGEAVIIDASKTITALHQNHGHNTKDSHKHPKSVYNSHLAASHGGWTLGHTADAPYATERRRDGSITVYDKHRLLYS